MTARSFAVQAPPPLTSPSSQPTRRGNSASTNRGPMVSNRDDVHTPACRFHRPCGADLRLHPNSGVGRRWTNMVRGRSAYTPLRYRHSRDGWDMSSKASLPRRRSHRGTRSSCRIARQPWRCAPHGSRNRARASYAMQVSWFGRRQSHGRILQFAPIGRYFLRDGARRLCREMGSVLARSSLQLTPSI